MTRLTLIFLLFTTVVRAQLPVIVHESFDVNTYGWLEHETATHKVMFQNGKYFMEAPSNGWMSCVAPYVDDKKDFSFEATFTQVDGDNDNGLHEHFHHHGQRILQDPVS
jgi:hypothetical protein